MFEDFEDSRPQERKIKLIRNGRGTMTFEMRLDKISMREIIKAVAEKWDMRNITNFRIFTNEGVEIFEDDLKYLSASSQLYISKGEEFDQMSQFSEYEIIKTLGEGGFGKVVLGEHQQTKEKVAIKIIKTGAINNAMDIDMVFREAEFLQQLKNKHIVRIINCYALKDMQVVFIMEHLEGGELLDYVVNKKQLSEQESLHFFKQVTDGMAYCHREKMIHRDLKLENLLLTKKVMDDGELPDVKIVDFGIAGICSDFDIDNADAGTLKYMAPEVLQGKHKAVTQAVDIWAMGVILYSMLFGELPFQGNCKKQLLENIVDKPIKYPKKKYEELSNEVKDLLKNILNPDMNERISISDIQQHPWILGDKMQ